VKLFPAFLLVYFLATRRWRGVAGFVVGFLALNLLALGILGGDAVQKYAAEIAPLVAADNVSSWYNASVAGYWMRLFAPTPSHRILPLADAPALGGALAMASQAVVLGVVTVVAWRARDLLGRDRAIAVTTTGMLLVGPLTWPHGLLLLLVPVALLLVRPPVGWSRWLLYGCLGVMWLPASYLSQLLFGAEQAQRMMADQHDPLTPLQNLASASIMNYVLVALFILTLRLPKEETRAPLPR
jgi:alpha-1,2-mannosyltransferase